MRAYLPVFALVLLLAVSVRAEEGDPKPIGVKTGARATVGSGHYLGRGAYLQYGDVWRVKGSYSDYRFDGSTGTTRTAALRGSYQGENLSAGVNASVTPLNDSYKNRAFGLDAAWTFLFGDDKEDASGIEEAEVGAFWSQTRHVQHIEPTPALPSSRDIVINQHDLGVNASVTGWDFTLSADASRSIYDQDFSDLPAAARKRPRLAETASLVNGFPRLAGSARLEYERFRSVTPYVSVAVTRYQLQPQPAATTGGAGASLRFGGLGLDLGYEVTRQKGADDTKYLNFGGSWRF